jgi:hypothetical protein
MSAWHSHRDTCKQIQMFCDNDFAITDRLLQFGDTNMVIITRGGLYALELRKDSSQCFCDIFMVFLHPKLPLSSLMSANDTGPESDRYMALIFHHD